MKMKRLVASLILILALSLGCGGQGAQKEAQGKAEAEESLSPQKPYVAEVGRPGGRLVMSTISDPKSFNPIVAQETSTTAITGHIFEGLTALDGLTGDVKAQLAESWQVSPDGLVWTITLRDGVKWADGEPFTAEDVVFTFKKLVYNPKIPTSSRDIFTIDGQEIEVEKIDDLTVRFTLPKPFAPFLRALSQDILPEHLLKDVVAEGRFASHWGVDASPEEVVGTGPFKLKSYLSGQKVILEANPLYWKRDKTGQRLPYLQELLYLIVSNQDVDLLKFQQGELDLYGMRGRDYPILKPGEQKGGYKVYRLGPAMGSSFLFFNMNTDKRANGGEPFIEEYKLKWFTNVKFRQAVAHALDKEAMIKIVMNGLGYPQHGPMSPSEGFFYTDDVNKYPYDLEKAKKLLREAGFEDRDGDKWLEDEEDHKVEFTLFTNSGNTEREQMAALVRKDLENIGLKVYYTPLQFNTLVSKLDSSYEYDCILLGLTGGIEPHFGSNVWLSHGHLHMWHPKQKEPATPWEARIDQIFIQGVSEMDSKKRKALYDEWQRIVSDQLPLIFTVLPENLVAIRNTFGNLYPTPFGVLHNLEEIYLK